MKKYYLTGGIMVANRLIHRASTMSARNNV
jgi:hypothetical protein